MRIVDHQFFLGDFKDAYDRLSEVCDIDKTKEDAGWKDLYSVADVFDMRHLEVELENRNKIVWDRLNTPDVRVYAINSYGKIISNEITDSIKQWVQDYMDEKQIKINLLGGK